jgi:hypothetical protein
MRREGRVAAAGEWSAPRFLRDAAAEQLGDRRLAEDDLRVGALLAQHAPDARERAAGAVARDPVVEALALEIGEQLARRRVLVDRRVVGGLELARVEPAVGLGQLLAFLYIPMPLAVRGVRTTLAPRKRIMRRRSMENESAIVTTSG